MTCKNIKKIITDTIAVSKLLVAVYAIHNKNINLGMGELIELDIICGVCITPIPPKHP